MPVASRHLQLAGLTALTGVLLLMLFAWPTSAHVAATTTRGAPTQTVEQPAVHGQGRWVEDSVSTAKKRRQVHTAEADAESFGDPPAEIAMVRTDRQQVAESDDFDRELRDSSAKAATQSSPAQLAAANRDGQLHVGGAIAAAGTAVLPGKVVNVMVHEESRVDLTSAAAWATAADRERSGAQLMAAINFDLSTLGYTISFEPPRASLLGQTVTTRMHIEIYVRPGMSEAQIVDVISHEIGHAVDHILISAEDRERWSAARRIDQTVPWWPSNLASDLNTPAGDFAECVGSLVSGSPSESAWGDCADVDFLLRELIER